MDKTKTMTAEERKELETIIALGGREVPVVMIDGTEEVVTVRLLKTMKAVADYARLVTHEMAVAGLFTGRDAEWLDRVMPESVMDIIAVGEQLNLPAASRLAERRSKQEEAAWDRMNPAARQLALDAYVRAAESCLEKAPVKSPA